MIEVIVMFFFFKQKTAYELRISDWSSDVCSSDLSGSRTSPGDLACRNGSPDTRAAHEDRSIDLAINDCLSSPERDGRIGDVGRGEVEDLADPPVLLQEDLDLVLEGGAVTRRPDGDSHGAHCKAGVSTVWQGHPAHSRSDNVQR